MCGSLVDQFLANSIFIHGGFRIRVSASASSSDSRLSAIVDWTRVDVGVHCKTVYDPLLTS